MSPLLRPIAADAVPDLRRSAVDATTIATVAPIISDVRSDGDAALRRYAEQFGEVAPAGRILYGPAELEQAFTSLTPAARAVLQRTADRIRAFADAQAAALRPVWTPVPGGRAGLRYAPVARAGCYAPGGRFPLPSSVLMTAVTARAAGVASVWVASPKPAVETLAAAHVAGADALLAAGGAQAIAALAWGTDQIPACDAIVGPGSKWVTAAKQLVAGEVTIDMLAGPSELVVLADATANPARIAADLLAQAEHDPDALPILVSTTATLCMAVDRDLEEQLQTLPTAEIARAALQNGFSVVVSDLDAGIEICDRLAPEHLAVHTADAAAVAERLTHYGAVFVGEDAAEVLGDYGAGPNHVLPTGGTARSVGALSVSTFLRVQTWLELDRPADARELIEDTVALARMEGLEAHARAAEQRLV